ncbi:MAG: hypothetical protein LQ344_001440 [Seirophora lacunosa]|nr:MAG: hypothetical protein LQ344_001440 [Seirophora lacunosa]
MALELHQSQQSQASSIDSATSRDDGHRPVSYKDSPPRSRSQQLRESTPLTSLSNQSSQHRTLSLSPVHLNGQPESGLHQPLGNDASCPVEHSASYHARIDTASPYTSPPKRTASGQEKWASEGQPTSPNSTTQSGHSRHTSTGSKASQITDLSHDLRTRLSYAMFKVQNGWQSHNLNELEAMALPRTSPISVMAQLHHAATSPPRNSPPRPPMALPTKSPLFHQPEAAGQVFLQKQATGPNQKRSLSNYDLHHRPSLEPPVNFLPRNSDQLDPSPAQLPHLDTTNVCRNGTNGFLSPIGLSTPPRRPAAATTRTPSQKSDMEKDAVETLMFMSSPVNSGYHPSAVRATATSPARNPRTNNSTMSPTRRVNFTSGRNTMSPPPNASRLTTAAEIDRVLDEMRDRYSSSDED